MHHFVCLYQLIQSHFLTYSLSLLLTLIFLSTEKHIKVAQWAAENSHKINNIKSSIEHHKTLVNESRARQDDIIEELQAVMEKLQMKLREESEEKAVEQTHLNVGVDEEHFLSELQTDANKITLDEQYWMGCESNVKAHWGQPRNQQLLSGAQNKTTNQQRACSHTHTHTHTILVPTPWVSLPDGKF